MAFCQWLAVAGKSPETIRLRRVHIEKLARDLTPLGPFDVTAYDISGWMYAQNWAAETRRANRATVRAFYAWAVNGGLIDYNPAENLPSVKAAHHLPRPASESQVKYAMTTADPRVKLMVCLGAELGLRRAEVAGVHTGDLIGEPGGDWSLLVRGKGDKERIVPLPAGLAQELRALPEGWAFPSRRGGHLTPGWVAVLVKRHLPAGVTMHALRHRFATRAYKVDRDVFAVQELLGHSSPNTTRRYVKVAEDTLRSTVQGLADNTTRRWVGVR
jgi:integrase